MIFPKRRVVQNVVWVDNSSPRPYVTRNKKRSRPLATKVIETEKNYKHTIARALEVLGMFIREFDVSS
jgi:hypothetical protein